MLGDPVCEAVRLADGVGVKEAVCDGVTVFDDDAVLDGVPDGEGVTLGDGVGQGTVVVSDIMVFMRRITEFVDSQVNSSPTSVIATPKGYDHREADPPVLVT